MIKQAATALKPLDIFHFKFGTILRLSYPLQNFWYCRPLAVH